jgi:hypothetical protein
MSDFQKISNTPIEEVVRNLIDGKYDSNNEVFTAIKMINSNRYRFSSRELKEIFEKQMWWRVQGTIAYHLATSGFTYKIEDLLLFGNPACCGEWTIAHEMAKNGYMFSVDELLQLKNPMDTRGLTVADVMMINGHAFTTIEETQLEIDHTNFDYSAYASFDLKDHFEKEPEQPTNCPKCGGNFSRSDVEMSKTVDSCLDSDPIPIYYYSYLFLCDQCHWWCVRERWAEAERLYDGDLLLIGVARNRKPVGLTDPEPWKNSLADEHAYTHDLKLPFDLYQMFPKKSKST